VARTFSETQAWVPGEGQEFEIFSKKPVSLVSSGKKQISPLLPPRKTWKNPLLPPPWKNSFRRSCTHACKLHHFCKKLCCILPSGNTVQQHQCGKQTIAGWQTVHGVCCQTITKFCQITNNIVKILPNSAAFFIKRFALMEPILIVLLWTYSGKIRQLKVGARLKCDLICRRGNPFEQSNYKKRNKHSNDTTKTVHRNYDVTVKEQKR